MDYKQQTLTELGHKAGSLNSKHALVGFDGFVDKIMKVVDKRSGQGEEFEPMRTISDFGSRISAAAGQSTNIEIFPQMEKIGGNGPIMANAILHAGAGLRYIGALGDPTPHSVFTEFVKQSTAVSLSEPGITHALEFDDGKIMLGAMASLAEITYPRIVEKMGEGAFFDALSRADLVALVNWTMVPNMTAVFNDLLGKALPNLGPREAGRHFFFDLTDPEKRSDGDVQTVLSTITRFRSHGQVTLGLNLREALYVNRVLGNSEPESGPEGLKRLASRIRNQLELNTVVIHPTDSAACATRQDAWWVQGPYAERPKITTGAGDHFNAGFTCGQLIGLEPPACLTLAVAFSGYYVRTAKSPSINEVDTFIRNWT